MDTPSSQSTREPLSVFVIPHSVAPHRWWHAKHYQCLLLWRKKKKLETTESQMLGGI